MIIFLIRYRLANGKTVRQIVNYGTFLILKETDNKVQALLKQDDRHHDDRDAELNAAHWIEQPLSLDEQYEKKELYRELHAAVARLTEAQARRIRAYYFDEMTLDEIARSEGVHWTSVWESIQSSVKILGTYLDNP